VDQQLSVPIGVRTPRRLTVIALATAAEALIGIAVVDAKQAAD
jgi:hypothetical protein